MLPEMGIEPETDACQPVRCGSVNVSVPGILESDLFIDGQHGFKKCDNRNEILFGSILSSSLPAVLFIYLEYSSSFNTAFGTEQIFRDLVKSYAVQNINIALNQWWLVASDRTETKNQ
jgi:hypothetical protein